VGVSVSVSACVSVGVGVSVGACARLCVFVRACAFTLVIPSDPTGSSPLASTP
jgi:hypothetical protein